MEKHVMKNEDYQKICRLLEEKVNEIFLEMQNELDIQDGGIMPLDAFELDKLEGHLACHISKVLEYQKENY